MGWSPLTKGNTVHMRAHLTLSALLATLLWSGPTIAGKLDKTFDYSYQTVWSAAIRLIRADKGYEVKDKDKDNGYILFIYPGSGSIKECPAALEIFRIVDEEGYRRTQVKLAIAHQPSYITLHFLEELERKLKDDFGDPPPPRKPKKEKPPGPKKEPKAPR